MKGYLLDTNAALIGLAAPERLPAGVRAAMLEGPNQLSVVAYWEVLLKSMKGLLEVGDPRAWWLEALDQLAATPLTLKPEHVGRVYTLPPVHKDPFDRMMIAQSLAEDLPLVTLDGEIAKYAQAGLRVVV